MKSLNDLNLKDIKNFELVKKKLKEFKDNALCEIYLYLKTLTHTWKEEIKKLIYQRIEMLQLNQNKAPKYYIFQLANEVNDVIPKFDEEMMNECQINMNKLTESFYQKIYPIITSEIKKSSELNLAYLYQKNYEKSYWTEEQMDTVINSHIQFLKNELYDITIYYLPMNQLIFKRNNDFLDHQISEDTKQLKDYFNSFLEKIKMKNSISKKTFENDASMGVNYIIKETENIREIKVSVEIGDDLKTIIEQDF